MEARKSNFKFREGGVTLIEIMIIMTIAVMMTGVGIMNAGDEVSGAQVLKSGTPEVPEVEDRQNITQPNFSPNIE